MNFLVIAFAILMSACSSNTNTNTPNETTNELSANAWLLQKMGNQDFPVTFDKPISLEFDKEAKGKISGDGGCNHFFSEYTTQGNQLTLKGIGATEMACDNIATEIQFFDWLGKAQNYRIDKEGNLHIQCTSGELVFRPASYLPTGH